MKRNSLLLALVLGVSLFAAYSSGRTLWSDCRRNICRSLAGALISDAAYGDGVYYYDAPVYDYMYPESTLYGVYDYPAYSYYPGYAYAVDMPAYMYPAGYEYCLLMII